jgi:TRAP-type transport system small permease protein
MNFLSRALEGYCKLLEALLVLLLAAMVLMVFGNVVLRYAFNSGITVSEELSRWAFVWLTFLGAILAVKEGAHLGTDVLVSRLGPTGKKLCLAAAEMLMLYAVWLVFSGSLAQTRINVSVQAPTTGWSMGWLYSAGLVFAVSAAVFHAIKLARLLAGRLAEDELVAIQGSEDQAHGLPEPRP